MHKRAIIYRRESVAGEEKVSLDMQERAGREYCARLGHEVVAVEEDSGLSAYSTNYRERPGVVRAIEHVEQGRADVVVVYWLSRLSRDPEMRDQFEIMYRIEHANGVVESVTEPVDASTPGGWFMRVVTMAKDAADSRQKSQTWKDIHKRRTSRGLNHGGQVPWGYVAAPRRSDLPPTPHPVNGPALADAYERYVRGVGHRTLMNDLHERGFRSTRGKHFSLTAFIRLMDSGFAAGYLRVDVQADGTGTLVKGAHEPIIDELLWRRYVRERERRRGVHPKARQPHHWALGGGLVRCADCDGPMSLSRYEGPHSAVRCSRRYNRGTSFCQGNEVNRHKLDTLVGLWLGARISELAAIATDSRDVDERRALLAKRLDELHAEEERVITGRSVAARLVAQGTMTEHDFMDAKREADRTLARVADEIAEVEAEMDTLTPDLDVYDRLVRDASATPEEWHVRLRKVIRVITVGRETITIVPWRGDAQVIDRSRLSLVSFNDVNATKESLR